MNKPVAIALFSLVPVLVIGSIPMVSVAAKLFSTSMAVLLITGINVLFFIMASRLVFQKPVIDDVSDENIDDELAEALSVAIVGIIYWAIYWSFAYSVSQLHMNMNRTELYTVFSIMLSLYITFCYTFYKLLKMIK